MNPTEQNHNRQFKTQENRKGFKCPNTISSMKKRVSVVIATLALLFIISLSFTLAADNSTNITNSTSGSGFEKSYTCLNNQLSSKDASSLSLDEVSFSLMATAYNATQQEKLKAELLDRKDSKDCWPKGGCTIRDTSIALLALNYINYDTSAVKSWLADQTMKPTDLVWYLQIDSDASEKATCKISVDSDTAKTVYVNTDKTLSGSLGSCFTLAYNSFWLEINPNCYNKTIEVICDKDFLIATHFKQRSASTYYLSTTTKTSPVGGSVETQVNSLCFKQSGSCSYEGSLWASIALIGSDSSIRDKILPYLMVSANDNKRYIPSSFLYMLTGYDDYFGDLTNLQTKDGYWQISEQGRRYYDTAIALLALNGKAAQADLAKEYLLTPNIQGNGCYNNNIRDTAIILYASAPKTPVSTGGLVLRSQCKDYGFTCTTSLDCERSKGTSSSNFACSTGLICCNTAVAEKTCADKSGIKCSANQECSSGSFSSSSDSSYCCLGTCEEAVEPLQTECESQGSAYSCASSCLTSETESTFDCGDVTQVCCSTKAQRSYWWVWLLVLLVILLALAIIFRNQLKLWLFKRDSGFSKSPVTSQGRPPFPPAGQRPMMPMLRRMMPGQPMPRPNPAMMRRPPFPKDRELDDTLKKLKDMSK